MDELFFPNICIIQALLHTLNEISQNTKISTIIYSNSIVFFYYLYEFNHWRISGIRLIKKVHLQPPDTAAFRHVDVILS